MQPTHVARGSLARGDARADALCLASALLRRLDVGRLDHRVGVLALAAGALQLAFVVVVDAHAFDEAVPAVTALVLVDGHARATVQIAWQAHGSPSTRDPVSVSVETGWRLCEIVTELIEDHIGASPVVNADGNVVGIISSYVDALRTLAA